MAQVMGKFAQSLKKKTAAPKLDKPEGSLEQGALKDAKVRVTDDHLGSSVTVSLAQLSHI